MQNKLKFTSKMDKVKLFLFLIPATSKSKVLNVYSLTKVKFNRDFIKLKLTPQFLLFNIKRAVLRPHLLLREKISRYFQDFIEENRLIGISKRDITSIMIKIPLKVGVAAGAIYFTVERGVWKDSETTYQLYNETKENLTPYTQEIKQQIPKMPELNMTLSPLSWWNEGVKATCSFVNSTPDYISEYSQRVANHPEVQKIIDSLKTINKDNKS